MQQGSPRTSGSRFTHRAFGFAEVAPLVDALQDQAEAVRTAALRALVRLPLTPDVWVKVSHLIVDLLPVVAKAGFSESQAARSIPRNEVIEAAAFVPTTIVRERLREIVTTAEERERRVVAYWLARVRDPAALLQLFADLTASDAHLSHQAASYQSLSGVAYDYGGGRPDLGSFLRNQAAASLSFLDVSPIQHDLLAIFNGSRDRDVRFSIALALAKIDIPEPLELSLAEQPEERTWGGSSLFLTPPKRGTGPFPQHVTDMLRHIANEGADSSASLARYLLAGTETTTVTPASSDPASSVSETERQQAAALAAPYTEEAVIDPFSTLPRELAYLPQEEFNPLVTALFAHLTKFARTASEDNPPEYDLMVGGNAIVTLIHERASSFLPDIEVLFESYVALPDEYPPQLWLLERDLPVKLDGYATLPDARRAVRWQIAWTASRAGLRHVLAVLVPKMRDPDEAVRVMAARLIEEAILYLSHEWPPLFGGGSAPTDVIPQADLLEDAAPVPGEDVPADERRGERTVQGTASADFPPMVESKSDNLLTYAIAKEVVYEHFDVLDLPPEITEADLLVVVDTADFTVRDPASGKTTNFRRVHLNLLAAKPVEGQFQLTARTAETQLETTIYLRFFYGAQQVGRVPVPTVIVPTVTSMPPVRLPRTGRVIVSTNPALPADIAVFVNARADKTFDISVTQYECGAPKYYCRQLGNFSVRDHAWKYARSILNQFKMARTLPPAQRQIRITGLGLDIWSNLHKDFQDFYWEEMHGRNLSIAICSDEPYIPWELVTPPGQGPETPQMFGVAFSIARWRQDRPLPIPLTVSRFAVVAPDYAQADAVRGLRTLEAAQQEAKDLVKDFGAQVIPGTFTDVIQVLQSTEVQAIHFSGHGKFDPDDVGNSSIELTDQPLLATDIQGAVNELPGHPLVFLNACQVGDQGWTLTHIGSWADAFCRLRCNAFVGPYWQVNDAVARKAAVVFYRALRELDELGRPAKTVGQAMQEVRRHFWCDDEYRFHPTWLAYTLHGQPNVTICFTLAHHTRETS